MAAGKEIKRLRGRDVTASKAAKFIGVGVDRLRKWEERDSDPSDTGDITKVEAYFGVKLDQLSTLKSFDFVEKRAENGSGATQDISLQAIKNLTETGKIHAENYKVMVSNEARLISLLEKSTVDSGKDNGVASPKVMSGILVAMAKIASGTRWHSEDEALRELGRLLSPQVDESKKSKDIRVD